jgi:hypothetical protein
MSRGTARYQRERPLGARGQRARHVFAVDDHVRRLGGGHHDVGLRQLLLEHVNPGGPPVELRGKRARR